MWILYAFLSALAAALVAIFAKLGLGEVDPTLATTLRSIVMTAVLLLAAWLLGSFDDLATAGLRSREWLLLVLAGLAGAASWLFYFFALRWGPASAVVAIDRLSVVFVVVLAAVFLAESLNWRAIVGSLLMASGAALIALKPQDVTRVWARLSRLLG